MGFAIEVLFILPYPSFTCVQLFLQLSSVIIVYESRCNKNSSDSLHSSQLLYRVSNHTIERVPLSDA